MPKRISRIKATPSEFRKKMGHFLGLVHYGGHMVVIMSRGAKWAVLCPPDWFDKRSDKG